MNRAELEQEFDRFRQSLDHWRLRNQPDQDFDDDDEENETSRVVLVILQNLTNDFNRLTERINASFPPETEN
jgi:tRNA U34 5-carboxymethylaminomethyl modifying GTPase MnmE/TrmE